MESDDRRPTFTASARLLRAMSSLLVIAFVGTVASVFIVASAFILFPEATMTVVGGILIVLIVRWANRRDDPRQQKRPPEAP